MTSIDSPIEEAITRYYLFFAQMDNLKATLQRLPVDNVEKANCVRQLQNVEGECHRDGASQFSVVSNLPPICDLLSQRGVVMKMQSVQFQAFESASSLPPLTVEDGLPWPPLWRVLELYGTLLWCVPRVPHV